MTADLPDVSRAVDWLATHASEDGLGPERKQSILQPYLDVDKKNANFWGPRTPMIEKFETGGKYYRGAFGQDNISIQDMEEIGRQLNEFMKSGEVANWSVTISADHQIIHACYWAWMDRAYQLRIDEAPRLYLEDRFLSDMMAMAAPDSMLLWLEMKEIDIEMKLPRNLVHLLKRGKRKSIIVFCESQRQQHSIFQRVVGLLNDDDLAQTEKPDRIVLTNGNTVKFYMGVPSAVRGVSTDFLICLRPTEDFMCSVVGPIMASEIPVVVFR